MTQITTGAPTLLVVETEGAADISAEARAHGWTPLFLRTDAYASWLPAPGAEVGEVLHQRAPSFYDLYRLAVERGARGLLPVSLLEPESLRDALLRDLSEQAGAPFRVVANRPAAVELAFDKALTKRVLAEAGFRVIPGRVAHSAAELQEAAEEFGFPLVAKPPRDFTGKGFRIFREQGEVDAYLRKCRVTGLLVEPFLSGSELSLELVRWGGRCVAQPVVYKGETRLNPLEHPVYRPRLSPWQRGTALEAEVVRAGMGMAAALGLEGACEMEFVVKDGVPYLMEVNPRVSGVTRLCNAGGGANTFRTLARLAMGMPLEEPRARPEEIAVNLPIVVPTEDERVRRLKSHPAVRYVKPIDWMPSLPIKGSLLLQAGSLGEMRGVIEELSPLSARNYLDEMHATLAGQYVPA
jgi:phosphoribosylaminoimidazole carboxylase (NCAIR synthetase)